MMLNRYEVKIVTEMGVRFVRSRTTISPFFTVAAKKEVVDIKKGFVDNCARFWKLGQLVISSLFASKYSCNLRLILNLHNFLLY